MRYFLKNKKVKNRQIHPQTPVATVGNPCDLTRTYGAVLLQNVLILSSKKVYSDQQNFG